MADWSRIIMAELVVRAAPGPWDVLPGVDAPSMPICIRFPSFEVAVIALQTAGFKACGHAIPVPALERGYELTTLLRFSAGGGQDVVLARPIDEGSRL